VVALYWIEFWKRWTASLLLTRSMSYGDMDFLKMVNVPAGKRSKPARFVSGLSKIQLDDVWTHKLDKNTERLARLLSFPLLKRYGYMHDQAMIKKKNAAHQDK
jgi:hypothetical protein